jgi:nitrile hydratase accessory protein
MSGMITSNLRSPALGSERLSALPRLPVDGEEEPVFTEPWQAQAFALAVKLSSDGHFTWKEWADELAAELQAASKRGEPDDGSRYYEHWLAALERLVASKGLTNPEAMRARKEAWAAAYRNTPHGKPVELVRPADRRWVLGGIGLTLAAYWLIRHADALPLGELSAWPGWIDSVGKPLLSQSGFAAAAGLGTLLGVRHTLEPDHLAAVSTLLTGGRSSAKAAWLGTCWGIGHSMTLLLAGSVLVLLRGSMPAFASEVFEFCVVLLLVGFGLRSIHHAASPRAAVPSHVHAKPATSKGDRWTIARRPLMVGAVHGLAGSGALTALVMTTLPSMATQLAYMALFGIGSTLGMAVLSGLLGWPIARVGGHRWIGRAIFLVVGCMSAALGLSWGHTILSRLL